MRSAKASEALPVPDGVDSAARGGDAHRYFLRPGSALLTDGKVTAGDGGARAGRQQRRRHGRDSNRKASKAPR